MDEEKKTRKPGKAKKWLIGIGIVLLVLVLAAGAFLLFGQQLMMGKPGGGEPWADTDLQANIKAGMSTSPAEDFHLFVNYDWLSTSEIPAGYTSNGPFLDVQLETDAKARALFEDEELEGHNADLIRDFYAAYLDWDARNAAGVEPIRPTVEAIEALTSIEELSDFLCDRERSYQVPRFVSMENTASLNDATRYILDLSDSGFLLQDPGEYVNKSVVGRLLSDVYKKGSTAMLEKLGYSKQEAEKRFDEAIAFEAKLAAVCMTADEQMSPDYLQKINNEYSMADAAALAPNFPLERLISSYGYGEAEKLLVEEPAYLEKLSEVFTEENLPGMKSCMLIKYVIGQSNYVDQDSFNTMLDLQNAAMGSQGKLSDEEYAYQFVSSWLAEPLERCYLERYDAGEVKERITGVCEDVLAYYRAMLGETDWLSDATREAALEKLDRITVNVAYPEKWKDYSDVDLSGLSLRECVKTLSEYELEQDVALTNQPVDRGYWLMSTLECNAYYNPQDNSINILLGILGGDFYRDDMRDEELYGGIGAVIGHEISHAFDTNGAQFDANGDLRNWWTEEDYSAFTARAERLAAYYDGIKAFGSTMVKGSNIQTEAIADMAGLKCMLGIAKTVPDFDYELFFRQYAKLWRTLTSQQSEYISLQYDSHPLSYLRTNVTVQQFEEFYETFGIQPGDRMYLAPENRICVW